MARKEAIGFVETFGLAAGIAAADAGVKTGNVELLGYEYTKGDGMCTVKFAGNVGAVKAAIEAGRRAGEAVHAVKSVRLMARPADGIKDIMIYNAENVGGEIALAKGVRPKATNRPAVLVKNWKPKEEAKVSEAKAETPEPPVVEDLKEESVEPQAPAEAEETPVAPEAPAEKAEDIPVAEPEIVAPAPAEEKPVEAETPKAEAEPVKEEAPAVVEETPKAEEVKEPADDSRKKTSTGKKKSKKKKKAEE